MEEYRSRKKTELIIKSIIQTKGHEVSKIQQEELARLQNDRDKQLLTLKKERQAIKLEAESKRKQMEDNFIKYELLGGLDKKIRRKASRVED